jgi:hypothetical protein
MVSDILSFVSLGRNLIHTINELRGAVARPAPESASAVEGGKIESLESRIGELEARSNQQYYRIVELERGLERAMHATEALAHRMSAIFWVGIVGCGLGLIALIVSAAALARTRLF